MMKQRLSSQRLLVSLLFTEFLHFLHSNKILKSKRTVSRHQTVYLTSVYQTNQTTLQLNFQRTHLCQTLILLSSGLSSRDHQIQFSTPDQSLVICNGLNMLVVFKAVSGCSQLYSVTGQLKIVSQTTLSATF